jgi:hypothetical protein
MMTKTVIKTPRQNPYAVENIKASYEAVMKSTYVSKTTHKYVVFSPTNAAELDILDDQDLLLIDYPWTSEVVQAGNYYHEPKDSNDIPLLYTIVEHDYSFPSGIQYEVIDELDLSDYSSAIMEEAYIRTQNQNFFEDSYKTLKMCEEGGGPIIIDEPEVCGPSGEGSSDGFIINDCGCEIYQDIRKPGGCVRVDDTQLNALGDVNNFTGVRRICVFARDGWFKLKKTYTEDNGCWKVNSRFSGNGWFYFRLRSEKRGRVRSDIMPFPTVTSAVRLTTGKIVGPKFNDIQVNVDRRGTPFTSTGSQFQDALIEKKFFELWSGCTVNNALHEFHDFAIAEGISAPPPNLNILVNGGQTRGFASMLGQLGQHNFLNAVTIGAANAALVDSDFLEFMGIVVGRSVVALLLPISDPAIRTFVGDVTIGVDFNDSDAMKRLAYHEIGHSSHFQNVGSAYWLNLIRAEVQAGGHGNEFGPDAGLIALVESWPEHIAVSILSQRYSPTNTVTLTSAGANFPTWPNRLEFIHNESVSHVPIGLFNDLIDPISTSLETTIDRNQRNRISPTINFVQDEVTGFSNQDIDQILNSSTESISDFRQAILTFSRGNNVNDIIDLFNDY